MSTYLVLSCGQYRLLLATRQVVEIGEREGADQASAAGVAEGRRLWRERALEVIDLPGSLGVSSAERRHQVVVHDGVEDSAPLVLLDVGGVEDLVELPDDAFDELVCVTEAFGERFDACHSDRETGLTLLRLRLPLGVGVPSPA